MERIAYLLIVWLVCSFSTNAQDSHEKDWILAGREYIKAKNERRENPSDIDTYSHSLRIWEKGFSEGLAKVTVSGKAGFINARGQVVISADFKEAGKFRENLAPFENNLGKWGYLNTQGQIIIKPIFDWAFSFQDGLALVQRGEKWGFIDKSGKWIIRAQFKQAGSFKEGLAKVCYNKHGGENIWNFIDKKGKAAFPKSFNGIEGDFTNGLAIVSRDLGYSNEYRAMIAETYVIDRQGRELWPVIGGITWFSEDLLIMAAGKNDEGDLYSAFDRTGESIFEARFSYLSEFSEGLSAARVGRGDKYGFIDRTGKFLIEPTFELAYSFSEGLAGAAAESARFGYIDKSGNWIIQPQFQWVGEFKNGIALVVVDDKTGYIDRSGRYIWEPTK